MAQEAENPSVPLGEEDSSNEESSDLYESDEFRMYCYKVLPCAKRASHEWTSCPFAHPNEKARRRDPRIYKYLAIPCPDTKEGKTCPRGDDCPNCHSLFEYWLHPSRYRTQLCRNNDGSHCKRQICFFAHSIEELRVPDHSHLNIPEVLLKQQAADKAATDGQDSSDSSHAAEATTGTTTTSTSSSKEASGSTSGSTAAAAKKERRASKGTSGNSTRAAKQCGSPRSAAATAAAGGGGGGLVTTTSGMLPTNLELPQLPASPCGPVTPMPLLSANSIGPYGSALAAGYGSNGGGWSTSSTYMPRSASLDHHVFDGVSCFSAPGTPATALRRGSLDLPALRGSLDLPSARGSLDLPPSGRCSVPRSSLDTPGATNVGVSALFSSSMIGDPEVPDPGSSPRSAAMQQLKQQQHMLQLQQQQEQLEAAVGAALSYEQQVLQLQQQQQQQQQAAWLAGRADYPATGSPPLSPTPSSMIGSGSTLTAEELFSTYSPAASSGGSSAACWAPGNMPRTLSGPAAYGPRAGGLPPSHPAFRYSSLDASHAAAAAAASAAEMAAQVQMAALQRVASMGPPAPQYSVSAALPPSPQQRRPAEQQQLNLQDVAELVDSVNRGDLGECGNQVLTGVIGLLMQQLQQQQLLA